MTTAVGDTLFTSERLRATFRSAGAPGRPLVVTFDSLTADLRIDRPGFGENWLAQVGYDAVHIVATANAWYQHPDMPALCEAVAALTSAYPRAVAYGSSMGGYAAIRFAERLGAEAAVAISPQFSVDPAKAPFEPRWADYAAGLRFLWDDPPATPSRLEAAYVIYDPVDLDRRHVELLAQVYPVVALPLRHAGHPAGTFLAETGLLAPTVLTMIDGRFDPAAMRGLRRAERRRSGKYHFVLAGRQPASRPRLAHALAARAVELNPQNAGYLSALARSLELKGEDAEAEALRRRAVELMPDEPAFRLPLADVRLRRGAEPAEVIALVSGLDALGAQRSDYFMRAVELLFLCGAFAAARDEARAAARRLPHSRPLRTAARQLSILAVPGLGRLALEAARRARIRWRRRRWRKRLVGAAGFEPTTP